MARRKNPPESVRLKTEVSDRLRDIRTEMFGERGGPELARRLGIPMRTWYNYESGVTVPAEVILKFMELTSVEPIWLLHGKGPKVRVNIPAREGPEPDGSVSQLLRTALRKLEEREALGPDDAIVPDASSELESRFREDQVDDIVLIGVDGNKSERLTTNSGPRYVAARREWLAARRDLRCIRCEGNSMAPIAAHGAFVAFSDHEDNPEDLNGQLVVASYQGAYITRRFELSGRYAFLRAENPEFEPSTLLINLDSDWGQWQVRRVLWIATPH